MTKRLANFAKKIVHLLWLKNSGYTYYGIIIPVNVTGKYSKSSFKISRWQRYCLHNLKDPLGKDALNPVSNTEWSSGVCWKVPVKC